MRKRITFIVTALCLLAMIFMLGGCEMSEEDLDRIASAEQAESIQKSIDDLTLTDTELKSYITEIKEAIDGQGAQATDILAGLEKLEKYTEALKADNEVLRHKVDCLTGKHVVDEEKIKYKWSEDDYSQCRVELHCKYCSNYTDEFPGDLSLSGTILTATFDKIDRFSDYKPAGSSLDLSDATEMTNSQIRASAKWMADHNDGKVILKLASDAGSDVFGQIAEVMNIATDGSIELTISGAETIPEDSFYCNSALKSLTLGEGVKTIEYNAFNGCANLSTVSISSSVLRTIGDGAFEDCTSLTSFTFPNNVADGVKISIGDNAFSNTLRASRYRIALRASAIVRSAARDLQASRYRIALRASEVASSVAARLLRR